MTDESRNLNASTRQKIVLDSGYSEVVFIDDMRSRNISIYSPRGEIPFAGHAVVGVVSYFQQELKESVSGVTGKDGPIEAW